MKTRASATGKKENLLLVFLESFGRYAVNVTLATLLLAVGVLAHYVRV